MVSIDETTDAVGRHVVNVIVRRLDQEDSAGSYLLSCDVINAVNNSTICGISQHAMQLLWPSGRCRNGITNKTKNQGEKRNRAKRKCVRVIKKPPKRKDVYDSDC
ncbi:hypothetical protein ANN_18198 [Periplaneta americana]|uniref:PDZ domain-containing protein n=1 Tax=Periplaneta americana TaxID=6978 RepID=A0ABQ8SN34_PERAM|nr:hypothetical protein ANN_18198 [Periplaneta americana]